MYEVHHFFVLNTKISDNNADLEKCPECLQRFHIEWQREILSKRNFFDFESFYLFFR
jgi:hypothetical protein